MTVQQHIALDWEAVNAEVTHHLQSLIRLDTRNPPGNETLAAEYLRDVLSREGIACEIVGRTPDRGSLVARIKGDGSARPLLLMSHTDVVAVEPDKWTHDPFAAEIVDGTLFGRGALDMKHMVAMELQTMLLLKRLDLPLKRDVIFMAAADEEVGGREGAGWIARNRPELIDAEYALNEGGGAGFELNGVMYYGVQTAEKGTARFRLRTRGMPGHGSQPHDDNAIFKLARLLAQLERSPLPVHLTATVRAHIGAIAATQPPEVAAQLQAVLDPERADATIANLPFPEVFRRGLRSVIRNTVSPTILQAGSQINVIPSVAEAVLDGRILPGWTPDSFQEELQAIWGEEVELEWVEPYEPLEADLQSPLYDTIVAVLKERDPAGTPIPVLLSGATDAKHLAPLGVKVYGFAPGLHPTDWSRIHGHDEQIMLRSLHWGARTLFDVVSRFTQAG